jgi:hemerythrin-like domain-containing protein
MENPRRKFLKTTVTLGALSVSGLNLFSGCKEKEEDEDDDEGQKVSPPEDLMQEHGLLNRILLIYDSCKVRLLNKQPFERTHLYAAATVIRTFVEEYHEKQEEDYLFPRFEKANQLTDLVQTLRKQHKTGRIITDQIMQLSKSVTLNDSENQKLIRLLTDFNSMYRPHEAREDTILFPAFRKIVSKNEYDSLGEKFEKNEHKLFGKGGFESMVEKVSDIEKQLGIYELSQFTPNNY